MFLFSPASTSPNSRRQINRVVVRAELDYKSALTCDDPFWIGVRLEKISPIRFGFFQEIFRKPDDRLMLPGKILGTALREMGRSKVPEAIQRILSR